MPNNVSDTILLDYLLGDNYSNLEENNNQSIINFDPLEAEQELDGRLQNVTPKDSTKALRPIYPMPSLYDEPGNVVMQTTGAVLGGFSSILADQFSSMTRLSAQAANYFVNGNNPTKYKQVDDEILRNRLKASAESQVDIGKVFRTYDKYQDSMLLNSLPSGLGSLLGFWASGYLMGGAVTKSAGVAGSLASKLPQVGFTGQKALAVATGLGSSITGAMANSASLGREAFVGSNGDLDVTRKAILAGYPIGALEGIPIGLAYGRAAKMLTKSGVQKKGIDALKQVFAKIDKALIVDSSVQAAEEATQEFIQSMAENYTARELWDNTRKLLDNTGESATVGAILGFSANLFLGALTRQAHLDSMSKEDKELAQKVLNFVANRPTEKSTDKEIINHELAKNTGNVFKTLFNMSSDPEWTITTEALGMQKNASANIASRNAVADNIKKTMEQLPDESNVLHNILQFNANQFDTYLATVNEQSENDQYVFGGIQDNKIAGIDSQDLTSITQKIQNAVVNEALKKDIVKDLDLDKLKIPEEQYGDIIAVAALGLKGNAIDVLKAKYSNLHPKTLEAIIQRVQNYDNSAINVDIDLAYRSAIQNNKEAIGKAIKKESVKEERDETNYKVTELDLQVPDIDYTQMYDESIGEPRFSGDMQNPIVEDTWDDEIRAYNDSEEMHFSTAQDKALNNLDDYFDRTGDYQGENRQTGNKNYSYPSKWSPLEKEIARRLNPFRPNLTKSPGNFAGFFIDPKLPTGTMDRLVAKITKKYGKGVVQIGNGSIQFGPESKNPDLFHLIPTQEPTLFDENGENLYSQSTDISGTTLGSILKDFNGKTVDELLVYLNVVAPDSATHELLSHLVSLLPKVNVTIRKIENSSTGEVREAGYRDNEIVINPYASAKYQGHIKDIVTHEMLHAYLKDYLNSNSPKAKLFIGKIEGIIKEIDRATKQGLIKPLPKTYFETGVHDFLSYAFANGSELRNALRQIPGGLKSETVGKENLWTRFVEAIRDFFKEVVGFNRTLLDDLTDLMDRQASEINKFHSAGLSKVQLADEVMRRKNIDTMRPNFNSTAAFELAQELDYSQTEDQDGDTVEDMDLSSSLDQLLANAINMELGDFYKTIRTMSYPQMLDFVAGINNSTNNLVDKFLENLWRQKYYLYQDFNNFKRNFIVRKLKGIKQSAPKAHLSIILEKRGKSIVPVLKSYGSLRFKTPEGTTRNSFMKTNLVERLIEPLERNLGLEAGSISIAYINDFTKNGRMMRAKNLSNRTLGKYDDTTTPTSEFIAHMFNNVEDQSGNKYVYLGNFSDKETLPVLQMRKEVYPQFFTAMENILNNYLQLLKPGMAHQRLRGDFVSAISRNYLSDLWLNAIDKDGNIDIEKSVTRLVNGKDYIKWMKRGGLFIQPASEPLMDKELFEELSQGNWRPTESYNDTPYVGMRLDQEGNIKVNAMVFDVSDPNFTKIITDILDSIGPKTEQASMEELAETIMTLNRFLTPTSDGASFYLFNNFDKVYKHMNGTLKNGALKNVYISKQGETPVFIKHAMHGISPNSLLGQYMKQNNIGVLVSSESIKVGIKEKDGYEMGKPFELDLQNFYEIKEENNKKTDKGPLKQVFNGSGLVRSNPALTSIDPNNDLGKAVDRLLELAVERLKTDFNNFNDQDFHALLEKIVFTPKSYKETKVAEIYSDLLNMPSDEARVKFRNLINDPVFAEIVNATLSNYAADYLEDKFTGDRLALTPDMGYWAENQTIDPITKAIKMHIMNRPISDKHFIKAVPNRKVRELLQSYLSIQKKIPLEKNKVKLQEYSDHLDTIKAELVTLNNDKPYGSIAHFVGQDSVSREYIKQYEKQYLNERIDPRTGRLKDGYVVISHDVAKRLGVRPGDKVITIVTPTDSLTGIAVVEVAATVQTYGDRQAINENSIIMNSEYIQSVVGKDFDIDTIAIIPYNNDWDTDSWHNFTKVISKLKDSYITHTIVDYNKVLKNSQFYPITPEKLFSPARNKIMQEYATQLLGKNEKSKEDYLPFTDFHNVSDKFAFNKAYIITERLKHTLLSAIDFKFKFNGKELKINHTDWFKVHNLQSAVTNHAVDAPAVTAIFEYNGDLSQDLAQENMFKEVWKTDQETDVSLLKDAVQKMFNGLFGRAIKLTKGRDIENGKKLDFYGQIQMIKEQRYILNLVANKDIASLKQLFVEEDIEVRNLIYEVLETYDIGNLNDYPLFQKIMAMPRQYPIKGVTFEQSRDLDQKVVMDTIRSYPGLKKAFNEAFVAESSYNERTKAGKPDIIQVMNAVPRHIRTETGAMSKIGQIKREAIAIMIGQYEVANEKSVGDMMLDNAKARAAVFPMLFQEVMKQDRVVFNPNHNGYRWKVKEHQFDITKGQGGGLAFKLNGKVVSTESILKRSTPQGIIFADALFADNSNSLASTSSRTMYAHRANLNKLISFQDNLDLDLRKTLLKRHIFNNVYKAKLSRDEQLAFWLTSILQEKNEETLANNFIVNKDKAGRDRNVADFQTNNLLKELMSGFEAGLFEQYNEYWSYLYNTITTNGLQSFIDQRFSYDNSDSMMHSTALDEENLSAPKQYMFNKYLDDMQVSKSTMLSFNKFRKTIKTQGYEAGYKQLQELGKEISVRMALAEAGINAQDMLTDLQRLSSTQFRKKYDESKVPQIDKAIQRHIKDAHKLMADIYMPEGSVTDQSLNNLESMFWLLHHASKPYRQHTEPTNWKLFNQMIANIRSFSHTAPDKEVKTYIFADEEQVVDTVLDLNFKNKTGWKNLTVRDAMFRLKDYPTRMRQAVGEMTIALIKNEMLAEQIKLMDNVMRERIDNEDIGVTPIANYAGAKGKANREAYIKNNQGRKNAKTISWLIDHLQNYGSGEQNTTAELKQIYALAKNMYKNYGIYMTVNDKGEVLYHAPLLAEPTTDLLKFIDSSTDFVYDTKKDGQKALRMLAAIQMRYIFDIQAKQLFKNATNYLKKLRADFSRYEDIDTSTLLKDLENKMLTELESLGIDAQFDEDPFNGSKHGNYIPTIYPERIMKSVAKDSLMASIEKELETEIIINKRLLAKGDPSADPLKATMTKEELEREVSRRADEERLRISSDSSIGPMSERFMKKANLDQYEAINDDVNIIYDYVREITKSVFNDLNSVHALISKRRAHAVGEKPWLIDEMMQWFADQTSNKFLSSRNITLDEAKIGQEVNFNVDLLKYDDTIGKIRNVNSYITGAIKKVTPTEVELYVDATSIKRRAAAQIEKYRARKNYFLNEVSQTLRLESMSNLSFYFSELGNLQHYGYITEQEIRDIGSSGVKMYAALEKAYENVYKDPSKYGKYNRADIRVIGRDGQVQQGTHINRYIKRGISGFAEALGRETGNRAIIEGTGDNIFDSAVIGFIKSTGFVTDNIKRFLNWTVMGGWSGVPAFFVNYLGAYKANRVDSWIDHQRYAAEWTKVVNRIKSTPTQDLSEADRVHKKQLETLGLLNDLADISLQGQNIDSDDMLLDDSFAKVVEKLAKATKQSGRYVAFKKAVEDLEQEYRLAKLNGDGAKAGDLANKIEAEKQRWLAHIQGLENYGKQLTEEEENTLLARLEKSMADGIDTEVDYAQKYDLTPGQALKLFSKQVFKKLYTSPVVGVGLQQKAEVQRLDAYGIGYLKAIEYGYSATEAHMLGVRMVERAHALYDAAHKQKGANTKGGKLMYMYSTYKYNAFKKFMKTFKDSIPQAIKNKKRLTSWSDWPGIWENIKRTISKNIEYVDGDEALKGMIRNKNKGIVTLKDSNLSGYLFSRMALGMVSAQLNVFLLRGLANSDDPVTQSFYDVVTKTIKLLKGSDDKYLDQEVMWAMQSTIFWAGLPQMMTISAPITAAAIDWETAANGFKRGRFAMQSQFMTERAPNEIRAIFGQDLGRDDLRIVSPQGFDKLLGIKLLGYTKYKDEWIDYRDRVPMVLNPLNWIPGNHLISEK